MSQSATGHGAKRQWPLWALAAVSLAWFLITLAASTNLPFARPELLALLVERATMLFPPLIVLLLMAAFIPSGRRAIDIGEVEQRMESAARATAELEDQLRRIDDRLAVSLTKVEQLQAAASSEAAGLAATAAALEVAAGTMALSSNDLGRAVDALQNVIPVMATQASEAEVALRIVGSEARRHIETVEGALAQVASHGRNAGREAEAMVSTMQGLIAQIDQSSTETTKTITNRAYTLDAAVSGVLDRSAEAFASIGETLGAQARSVEQMVATARTDLDGFGAEWTRVIGQHLDVLLGAASQLKGEFSEQLQMSDQLRSSAAASIADIQSRLEALRDKQSAVAQALVAQTDEMAHGFERRLAEMADRQHQADLERQERMALTLFNFEGQLTELRDRQVQSAERMQDTLAGAIGEVENRLERLKARQAELGADMEAEADRMIAGVELRLGDLRARQQQLAASMAEETAAGLDRVEGRFVDLGARAAQSHAEMVEMLVRIMSALGNLGDALEGRQAAVGALEQRIGGLLPAFDSFSSVTESRLPELAGGFESLSDRGRMVSSQLDAMADRIESQVALLRDSSAAFERDHAAVMSLSQMLAGEFETARGLVAEIHSTTEQTAISTAARMVENMVQVRASVNSTASEIRSLLSSVVAEAQQSLDDIAINKAEAAFGAPIRLQIAALEDATVKAAEAAGSASEKLTARLVELMRMISETEARVDEVDTRMDVRARDTLAARSIRLVDSLNKASVDVAHLLAVDVGDSALKRHLDGDKSLFDRTTVRLADKDTACKIAEHYQNDEAFQAEASHYLDQFEQLIRRILKDPDGESFALVLLSSDIGKLYVMIAEAIGRPVTRKTD